MQHDFVAEILRATTALRSGDPAGATAIIQAALAAGGLAAAGSEPNGAGGGFKRPQQADAYDIEGTLATDGPDDANGNVHPRPPAPGQRPRQPLGDVIRILAEGRKRLGPDGRRRGSALKSGTPDLSLPDGAELRDLHYSCTAGARRYRLYVPASASDGLQGLIVMLHGCTQTPEDFAAGTGMNGLAEVHRLLVVYPAQTNGDNAMSCWNWFHPGDQRRDAGEPAIIAGLTTNIRDDFAIRHDRVFVAGLSAGGAMAAILGETYPELYAGIGIHSGLAYGSANDVTSAFSAMRGQSAVEPPRRPSPPAAPRVIVFHGGDDTTVHPTNADRIVARQSHQDGAAARTTRSEHAPSGETRGYRKLVTAGEDGTRVLECWIVDGAEHAWSGGRPTGTYTDPRGPDASAAMVDFFLDGCAEAAAA